MAGAIPVTTGSVIMMSSALFSLFLAKTIAEVRLGRGIGWGEVTNMLLTSGPGLSVCFGVLVIIGLSVYGFYLASLMLFGRFAYPREVQIRTLVVGLAGAVVSAIIVGGILGVIGAILILIGGAVCGPNY